DDYAHHPEEIRMFLSSIKLLYPGSKVTAIFQPHLFTRTRDLADGFAASLDLADETILLPIYPAREEPIPGVTASVILDKMTNASHRILEKNALLDYMRQGEFEVICTIGAGDIDKLVKPIAQILKDKG
ncbi:MAG TPA: cyanophycin synthetase, partial [Chitinophagales bacterium]|nr:cyanophycin synthetase [Chitinophagales bacterium]